MLSNFAGVVDPISDRRMCVAADEAHAIGGTGETSPAEQLGYLDEPYVGATVIHDELNITLHCGRAREQVRKVVHGGGKVLRDAWP